MEISIVGDFVFELTLSYLSKNLPNTNQEHRNAFFLVFIFLASTSRPTSIVY